MPAYIVALVDVTDPVQYEEYRQLTPGAIAAYGGRFVARGGEVVSLEGEPVTSRVVIIEFESLERAKEFYASPEYTHARSLRADASVARLFAVDGANG